MKKRPHSKVTALFHPIARLLSALLLVSGPAAMAQNPPATAPDAITEEEPAGPEPLRINRYPSYYYGSQPLTPTPEVLLRFNGAISEKAIRQHVAFRDKNGRRRIPVEVRRPSKEAVKPLQPYGGDDPENLLPLNHFVLLKPMTPLPVGVEWRLEMTAGLASNDGKFELAESRSDRLGTLSAFNINRADAVNHYDTPKSIRVSLNKRLHESITQEILEGFVNIQPQPENLEIESSSYAINFRGDFKNGSSYRVNVLAGLVGHDETRLERDFAGTVKFEPNSGFVTLPAFSKAQNASGSRRFDISTGNLKGVRVRVKQLNDRDLIYALRGYDQLYEGDGGSKQQIPYEIVPGKTIYDHQHDRTAPTDSSEKITLNWQKILGKETHAGLFICAEGPSATQRGFATGAQSIIQLTDIGLAWKQNKSETLLHAFSLETGAPLSDLEIQLLDSEAESLEAFSTDPQGVIRIPHAKKEGAKWLAARKGKDRHIIEFEGSQHSLSLWQFSIPYRYNNDDETERRILMFTDRPVYKPGERVHLKCITRLSDFDRLLPPDAARKTVRVKVFDARRRVIHDTSLEVSEYGSIEDSFAIPEEKTLGSYSVTIDFNTPGQQVNRPWRNQFSHQFLVAEYRPNTFNIAIDSKANYRSGEAISIPVTARYYMGKPLSKAQVEWHVRASRTFPRLAGFEGFRFGDYRHNQPRFTASETVRLDDTGRTSVNFELPDQGEHPAPMRVSVSTEITDINQQTVAESTSFTVDSSDFYLGVRNPEGVLRAGEPIPLSLAAVSPGGELYEAPVEATLEIEKLTYNTVKVRTAGGRMTTRSEEQLSPVSEQAVTIKARRNKETGLPVPAAIPVTLKEGGDYLVTLSAVDENGNTALTRSRLRILGAEERSWNYYSDNVRIEVRPDKERYRVGDKAKLLVRSPILGHALITTERGGVETTRSQPITKHESVVEVPIPAGAAPNLFASVMIVRGLAESTHKHPNTDYRIGYCQLDVDDPATELDVTIESDNEPYALPGSVVEVAAVVRDHKGKPVANTEVTFYAVDEGVLSLTGYQTPDPASVFHAPFPLSVRTGQTIEDLLSEDPLDQDFGNKGYVIGGGGGPAGPDPSRVRKNFKALAFWGGSMLTGPDGRVLISFTAPDNLTTFRIMAVAAAGNRFGSADDKLVINKPLILEPALPAFGNVKDLMDLSAVLHNNTAEALELEIEVNLDHHARFHRPGKTDTPTRRIERFRIPAGKTEALSFPVAFTRMGEAKWTWKATAVGKPELTDAVESTLQIGYPVPLLRHLENLTLTDPKTPTDVLASVDSKLLKGRGKIRVTLSNSRLLEALDALSYLLRYPYGCVEQTTSSTLPWLSTQRLRPALPQLDRSDEEVAAAIAAGTRRILSMQTSDGGLAYWPGGSKSLPWGSAYGGLALALAKKGGADLPEDRLNALWDYLSKNLRTTAKDKKPNLSDYHRCLGAWTLALAGKGEPAYHDLLYRERDSLSPDSRAVLALSMLETAGDNRDAALSERVGELLDEEKAAPKNDSHWYRESFVTAMRLAAWSQWDPLNSKTNQLVDTLMDSPRTRAAAWGSTYLNSWTVFALAEHTEASADQLAGTNCEVSFGEENHKVIFARQLSGKAIEFEFEGDHRKSPLTLQIDSDSRIYAHVEIESQPDIETFKAENHGFGITRTYHKLDAEGGVHPVDRLEVGDLILVSLHLAIPERERYQYLAIDDPLSATFEAINPRFKSQAGAQKNANRGNWKRLWTNHSELRADRALFFCDSLSNGGDYAVEYLARVVAPGEANAPPAKIEAMYEPHRYGLSNTARIVAQPLQLAGPKKVAQK